MVPEDVRKELEIFFTKNNVSTVGSRYVKDLYNRDKVLELVERLELEKLYFWLRDLSIEDYSIVFMDKMREQIDEENRLYYKD